MYPRSTCSFMNLSTIKYSSCVCLKLSAIISYGSYEIKSYGMYWKGRLDFLNKWIGAHVLPLIQRSWSTGIKEIRNHEVLLKSKRINDAYPPTPVLNSSSFKLGSKLDSVRWAYPSQWYMSRCVFGVPYLLPIQKIAFQSAYFMPSVSKFAGVYENRLHDNFRKSFIW